MLLGLVPSACALFSTGSAPNATAEPGGTPSSAPAKGDADPPIDYSVLSDAAAHPAVANFLTDTHAALSTDREHVTSLWAVDIGGTAKTSTDPIAIYLYGAHRSLDNAARLVEHCGAVRMAAQLREVAPFATPADAAKPAQVLAGWSAAGQSEIGDKPSGQLDTYQAKACITDVAHMLGETLDAAAKLEREAPHREGAKVVRGWAHVLTYATALGSPWPVPEQATRELAAFDHFVRTGKAKEPAAVKVKPVHPALVLLVEKLGQRVTAPGRCELLGLDRSDTARGSNIQVWLYASSVAMRTYADLLETCKAPKAAEVARKLPKKLDKPEDVDRVFEMLAPVFDDQESPERFCVGKASYVLQETLGGVNEAGRFKRSGINQSVPYAEGAFASFDTIVEQAESTPEGRDELARALLVDAIAQLHKLKRRPDKELHRYDD
ncbi:MAG TPA: hypothetical protein VG755_17910 [Nannocystaceae bacterium]|nr:hypothetical protein [Nannocystaceae bacterium]